MIAVNVTCTSANTGYNLYDLIQAKYAALNWNTDHLPNARITSITIQQITSGANGYIVPGAGAYANTGGVPTTYGYSFSNSGALWDKSSGYNDISIKEIFLGSDTGATEFAVLIFTA